MYTPHSFTVNDIKTIHEFIKTHSFATIFSQHGNSPSATHLPFIIDTEAGERGMLSAHMARANPLWKTWTPETQVLVVFTGPHAYISPGWYENQIAVPTWNYSAVHAYGKPQLIHDPVLLRPMVEALVQIYEKKEASTWDHSLMESIMDIELKAIVGFQVVIEKFEAKFKFNQNRSREDRDGVREALAKTACPFKQETASFMNKLALKEEIQ
jgi:transcriptional regulator